MTDIAKENAGTEALGAGWADRSDAFLVGYVAEQRPGQFHTPAIVEMQRRAAVATHELRMSIASFNEQTDRYSRRIEKLTWAMLWLAVIQVIAGIAQIAVAAISR